MASPAVSVTSSTRTTPMAVSLGPRRRESTLRWGAASNPVMTIWAAIVASALLSTQAAPTAAAILARYVRESGGEAAIRAVKSRATEGEFDNGRGLHTRYRIVEEAPNRRVTF